MLDFSNQDAFPEIVARNPGTGLEANRRFRRQRIAALFAPKDADLNVFDTSGTELADTLDLLPANIFA